MNAWVKNFIISLGLLIVSVLNIYRASSPYVTSPIKKYYIGFFVLLGAVASIGCLISAILFIVNQIKLKKER